MRKGINDGGRVKCPSPSLRVWARLPGFARVGTSRHGRYERMCTVGSRYSNCSGTRHNKQVPNGSFESPSRMLLAMFFDKRRLSIFRDVKFIFPCGVGCAVQLETGGRQRKEATTMMAPHHSGSPQAARRARRQRNDKQAKERREPASHSRDPSLRSVPICGENASKRQE